MKIYKSKYRNHWLSPYKILEVVFFWVKDDSVFYNHEEKSDAPYEKWVNFLNPICRALKKVMDFVHPEINYVKIDYWDTWNMDGTLSPIILPMLKQLKEKKHGSPNVDDEDLPENLRVKIREDGFPVQTEFEFDDYEDYKSLSWGMIHTRWNWIMDEMIFAFEHIVDDSWQEKFRSGEIEFKHVPCEWDEDGKVTLWEMQHGPNHTYECDYEGIFAIEKRIDNGLRLFGKYYRGLWD